MFRYNVLNITLAFVAIVYFIFVKKAIGQYDKKRKRDQALQKEAVAQIPIGNT